MAAKFLKIVGDLLGDAIDQPLAELGELAADLRLDIVGEQRAAVFFRQRDRGAALGEAGDAALAIAGNPVAIGRIEIGRFTLPLKRALTGPILTTAMAWNSVSEALLSSSQPGMQALSTSASLSLAHTTSRLAGSCTSPVMTIAIGVVSLSRNLSNGLSPWRAPEKSFAAGLERFKCVT